MKFCDIIATNDYYNYYNDSSKHKNKDKSLPAVLTSISCFKCCFNPILPIAGLPYLYPHYMLCQSCSINTCGLGEVTAVFHNSRICGLREVTAVFAILAYEGSDLQQKV